MLGVIPYGGDRVAVEIAHHQALGADRGRRPGRRRPGSSDPGGKPVHQSVVVGALLRTLVVSLVRRRSLRGGETERICRAGAVLLAVVGSRGSVGIVVRIVVDEIYADQRNEVLRRVKRREQRIDALGCARRGLKWGFAGIVLRLGIGTKIVIE